MPGRVLAVVPTYGKFDFALKAVRSFLEHTPGGKVLLVDDGSPDWKHQKWKGWPGPELCVRVHYNKNDRNLTRSWNRGLSYAREHRFEFCVVTNSDVLFTPGWWPPLEHALNRGADLVGPLTNAPGHRPKQQVKNYLPDYAVTDEPRYLAKVAARLGEAATAPFHPCLINGFCLAARTSVWWANAFDSAHVFNPGKRFKMMRNEDELQGRWKKAGRVIALVAESFVFHYRGVTRPGSATGKEAKGWFRPGMARK